MSSYVGTLPHFETGFSDWQVYTERLEQYFDVNNIDADKKKALLLTSIDEEIYKTLRDVCHPVLPKTKTYSELIQVLNKQFIVRTSVHRERIAFYAARQVPDESTALWFARIKKLSIDCKFGDIFEMVLLDRFISGMSASDIVDRLCEEDEKLTLQKAVDIATSKESSAGRICGLKREFDYTGLAVSSFPVVSDQPINLAATPAKRVYRRKQQTSNNGLIM